MPERDVCHTLLEQLRRIVVTQNRQRVIQNMFSGSQNIRPRRATHLTQLHRHSSPILRIDGRAHQPRIAQPLNHTGGCRLRRAKCCLQLRQRFARERANLHQRGGRGCVMACRFDGRVANTVV